MATKLLPIGFEVYPAEVLAQLEKLAKEEQAIWDAHKRDKGPDYSWVMGVYPIRERVKVALTAFWEGRVDEAPSWASYWKVDQAIECLEVGPEVRKELIEAMPNAYDDHPDDPDGEAGLNEWPEADAYEDRAVARVWGKLSKGARLALQVAHQTGGVRSLGY